jgi:hypothetical protein
VTDPIDDVFDQLERLRPEAVVAVFRRYGKPLADELPSVEKHPRITHLGDTQAIVTVWRIRTHVDVIANDYFVLEGDERLAVPGPLFAAAIAALSRAPTLG